jgi:hypothetical protein
MNLSGASEVNEGSVYVLTLGNVIDVGDDTVTTYTIDWGDGTAETINASDLGGDRQVTHTYTEGNTTPTIQVSLTDEDGTHLVATANITVNPITNLPTLSITDAVLVEENGNTYVDFTVSLSSASDQVITVNFNSVDGTASAGSDYHETNGVLSFQPGETSQTIRVSLIKPKQGDIDGDGDLDRDDMNLILAARNTPANPPQPEIKNFSIQLSNVNGAEFSDPLGLANFSSAGLDPRDLDGDGMITVLDARKLSILIISQ